MPSPAPPLWSSLWVAEHKHQKWCLCPRYTETSVSGHLLPPLSPLAPSRAPWCMSGEQQQSGNHPHQPCPEKEEGRAHWQLTPARTVSSSGPGHLCTLTHAAPGGPWHPESSIWLPHLPGVATSGIKKSLKPRFWKFWGRVLGREVKKSRRILWGERGVKGPLQTGSILSGAVQQVKCWPCMQLTWLRLLSPV